MTGVLAQIISITVYGNHFLKNGNVPPNFWPGNTTFQFCNTVDFWYTARHDAAVKPPDAYVAKDPIDWFHYLKSNNCKQLRLHYRSSEDQSMAKDHKLAGFVGGGSIWMIEAVYENYSMPWWVRWHVANTDPASKKPWSVSYFTINERQPVINQQVDLDKAKQDLSDTLTEIAGFAARKHLANWATLFNDAKFLLNTDTPSKSFYHSDLLPLGYYPLAVEQCLFAAGKAFVFGGMGSWNDLGFDTKEDNELYDQLSETLYANINTAIIAAINYKA